MSPPTKAIPEAKEPRSPIRPIPVGVAPAPRRNEKGMVSETAKFRELAEAIHERPASPAGKKHTASMGCKNTMMMIQ